LLRKSQPLASRNTRRPCDFLAPCVRRTTRRFALVRRLGVGRVKTVGVWVYAVPASSSRLRLPESGARRVLSGADRQMPTGNRHLSSLFGGDKRDLFGHGFAPA
jgi:hypothetical protein